MGKIRNWFDQLPISDAIEREQAKIIQVALIVWAVLSSPMLLFVIAPYPPDGPFGSMSLLEQTFFRLGPALLVLSPIIAFVFIRRGQFRLAVSIAVFGMLISNVMVALVAGNVAGLLLFYQVPIVIAGLLLGRRSLLITSGVAIAITILENILSSNSMNEVPITFLFVVATVLVTLLLERFGSVLRNALITSRQREAELEHIRDSLEQTVTERTATLRKAISEVEARAAAQAQLFAENEKQRGIIRELTIPIIPISAETVIAPLVGALDSERMWQFQEVALRALEQRSARHLVIDITGVLVVDTHVASGLLQVVHAARLIGSDVTLVGMRPEVAQALVGLGVELTGLRTLSDLQSVFGSIERQLSR